MWLEFSPQSLRPGWFILFIVNQKKNWVINFFSYSVLTLKVSLQKIKYFLYGCDVRPSLILMFDANLAWAQKQNHPDIEWCQLLCQVYNLEANIDDLNGWDLWASITDIKPPQIDDNFSKIEQLLLPPDEDEEEIMVEVDHVEVDHVEEDHVEEDHVEEDHVEE
jgi:hypothetical protein